MASRIMRAAMIAGIAVISYTMIAEAGGPNTSPGTAAAPNGASSVISGSALWYAFDYAGDRSKVEIKLQNGFANNLGFNLYMPDQITLPDSVGSPIGKGTQQTINCDNGKCASSDLLWAGDFFVGGTFYIQVLNQNAEDKPFSISVTGSGVTMHAYTQPAPVPAPYTGSQTTIPYSTYAYPTQPTYPQSGYYPGQTTTYPQSSYYPGQTTTYPQSGYYPGQGQTYMQAGNPVGQSPDLPAPTNNPGQSSTYPQGGYYPQSGYNQGQYPSYPQSGYTSGQYSTVPPVTAPYSNQTTSGCSYTVRTGDTLWSIATRYSTDMWQLARVNGLVNPNFIWSGQNLYIPNCH